MDKFLRHKLVSRLKGLEQEAKMLRSHINKAKGKKRPINSLQNIKSEIGWDARHHLLAYAYLRKVPYHTLEAKCRADNRPNVELILTIAEAFFDWQGKNPTKEKVEGWLAGLDATSAQKIEQIPEPKEEVIQEHKPTFLHKAISIVLHGLNGAR